jgi:hypothetical protein
MLGGPQSRSGGGGEEINFHPLSGLEPSIIMSVAQHKTGRITLKWMLNEQDKKMWIGFIWLRTRNSDWVL